jgi:long-subunit fatty acid transport protein
MLIHKLKNFSANTGGNMKTKSILLIAIILIGFNTISAQNFNDALRLSDPEILTSARALGMGNAYLSLSNDFSASLFNPAGFALIKKMEFSGGLNYNSFKNDAQFFNRSTNYSSTSSNLNQFGFAFPFPTTRGSFVLAFGYSKFKDFNRALKFSGFNSSNNSLIQSLTNDNDDVAYELGLSYPVYDSNNKYLYDETKINGKLNQSGNIVQEGSLNSWQFSGAIEFQENLFVGLTINIINGDFKRNREYWEEDINNNYPIQLLLDNSDPFTGDFQSFYFNDIIRWDLSGWNATIGILSKVDENVNLGATIKLPKSLEVNEIYTVDADAKFGTGKTYFLDPPIENRVNYTVRTPLELGVGASYSISGMTVALDANFIDYTQMEFSDGFDTRTRENKNKDIKDLFKKVLNLNAGFEYMLPFTGITVRGGFIYMPSAFKDDDSDFDKKFFTAGIGFKTGQRFVFDVGYAHGWWKDIGDNYGSNLSRTFQSITKDNLIFGIKYLF